MNDLVVELEGISKRFAAHVAVTGLSLKVPRGVVYGLLGPNGAGKTTSLRMMMNITMPDEGTVRLFGDERGGRHHSARIGYLPEERGLYPKMRVLDALVFLAEAKGVARAVARRKAVEWLERLGLEQWQKNRVNELSKGMQQKVQFASTVLHEPELLILDEPFAGLDPINQEVLKETVVSQARGGHTVIFSTHQMDVAEKISDAVCIIAQGQKVLDGRLADVKRQHGGTHVAVAYEDSLQGGLGMRLAAPFVAAADDSGVFAELTLREGAEPQQLLETLVRGGVKLRRFERIEPSLQRIFLDRAGAAARADKREGGSDA